MTHSDLSLRRADGLSADAQLSPLTSLGGTELKERGSNDYRDFWNCVSYATPKT